MNNDVISTCLHDDKTEYRKMNRILGAILLCLITSGQRHIIANEQQESIRLDWKKGTGSSFWEAEVNRFDVPSGAVVEVKGPKAGLIRVTGDQPTSIYGTITSSNPVYVINPHGVVVGPKGKINGIFGIPALDMQISSYTSKGHETDPVCYHSTSNSDLITFLTDEQREEIENSLYKTIKEYIWLGDIRIGGISKSKEVQVSPCCLEEFTQLENQKSGTHLTLDELIQAEIERVKIQRFITPYENLQGMDCCVGGIIRVENETPDSTCKFYQWRECFPRKSQNLNP